VLGFEKKWIFQAPRRKDFFLPSLESVASRDGKPRRSKALLCPILVQAKSQSTGAVSRKGNAEMLQQRTYGDFRKSVETESFEKIEDTGRFKLFQLFEQGSSSISKIPGR